MIEVYTDGSCRNKKGGWGYIILDNDFQLQDSGSESNTTNNRMELLAVINAIEFLIDMEYDECTLYTDSMLTMNCGKKLWKRNKNLDMWKRFDSLVSNITINWVWVKAHNGNHYNEAVDKLAYEQSK
jgi:ribonuclease HI